MLGEIRFFEPKEIRFVLSYYKDPCHGLVFHIEGEDDYCINAHKDAIHISEGKLNDIRYKALGVYDSYEAAETASIFFRKLLERDNG